MISFFTRLHRLRPSRPRHPLLRVGFALLGLGLVVVLVVGGVFVGLGMLAFRGLQRLMGTRKAAATQGQVLEAEYRVVAPRVLPQSR
jgi:hypothetical protein